MKNIVIGVCACVLIGLLILTSYTLHGRSVRKTEVENAMMTSMRNAMERNVTGITDTKKSNEALVALFLQDFFSQVDSNSQVTIHILDVDAQKGLMSAEAVFSYLHPLGIEGKVAARQTVIMENYSTEKPKTYYTINYIVNGESYKKYRLQQGSNLMVPAAPKNEEKEFVGWRQLDGEGVVLLGGMLVEQDCTYVAVFH